MTVRNVPPLVRYTGNGVITSFDWDWDMITDSSINVLQNNENVLAWSLQGMTVVFSTAPAEGDEIIIYRRTIIRQPDNYQPFGRFHSEKTELSMDRQTLIAQERQGDSTHPGEPNGIVGGSNLSTIRAEFDVTVVSERGTDAVVPMYDPDDTDPVGPGIPDGTILWGGGEAATILNGTDTVINGTDNVVLGSSSGLGTQIDAGIYSLPGNTNGVAATMRWMMSLTLGSLTEATTFYPNYNAFAYTSWCSSDPDEAGYWMRITASGDIPPTSRYTIKDTVGTRVLGEEFQMISQDGNYGPYISVHTFGDVAPTTRKGTFLVEICKDNSGQPDDNWAGRIISLEAIFNA